MALPQVVDDLGGEAQSLCMRCQHLSDPVPGDGPGELLRVARRVFGGGHGSQRGLQPQFDPHD